MFVCIVQVSFTRNVSILKANSFYFSDPCSLNPDSQSGSRSAEGADPIESGLKYGSKDETVKANTLNSRNGYVGIQCIAIPIYQLIGCDQLNCAWMRVWCVLAYAPKPVVNPQAANTGGKWDYGRKRFFPFCHFVILWTTWWQLKMTTTTKKGNLQRRIWWEWKRW